tara:strand:- start:1302 stop:1412 length:111 start_codon:yes stop_codon:yes gene_type:complete
LAEKIGRKKEWTDLAEHNDKDKLKSRLTEVLLRRKA